jgi:hypothetical protein
MAICCPNCRRSNRLSPIIAILASLCGLVAVGFLFWGILESGASFDAIYYPLLLLAVALVWSLGAMLFSSLCYALARSPE